MRAVAPCLLSILAAAAIFAPHLARAEDPPAPPSVPAAPPTTTEPPSQDAAAAEPTPPASSEPSHVEESAPSLAAPPSSFHLSSGGAPARDAATASSVTRPDPAAVFVTMGLGFAVGRVSDPHLAETRLQGPLLELHAGVSLDRHWTVGFGASSVEMPIVRGSAGTFSPSAGHIFQTPIQIQAGCTNCKEPPSGGLVDHMPLNVLTLGPEVQLRPMGDDGPFVGALTGIAAMPQLSSRVGGAIVARAGYRLTFARVLAASVQAGVDGQVYDGSSAIFPFAGVQLEAFITGGKAR